MAFKLAELFVDITANDKNVSQAIDRTQVSMTGLMTSAAAVGAAITGALAVGTIAISKFTALTGAQEEAQAKLAAVIKSTGGAAGFTAEQLFDQAAALQQVSVHGDEAIINMQAILATFKNISGEVFQKTTKATLDLADVMGIDLKSAALQLGKALNDPLTGLTFLNRAGITFSNDQKDMIRTLVESNKLLDAQSIILDEVMSQFGGGSAARAGTTTGRLTQMQNALGDAGEQIGAALSDGVKKFADTIKDELVPIVERVATLIGDTGGIGGMAADLLTETAAIGGQGLEALSGKGGAGFLGDAASFTRDYLIGAPGLGVMLDALLEYNATQRELKSDAEIRTELLRDMLRRGVGPQTVR